MERKSDEGCVSLFAKATKLPGPVPVCMTLLARVGVIG